MQCSLLALNEYLPRPLAFRRHLPFESAVVWSGQPADFLDYELGNRHPRLEKDACRAEIYHLKREGTIPIGVNGRGSKMNQETNSSPAALPLDACRQARIPAPIFLVFDR